MVVAELVSKVTPTIVSIEVVICKQHKNCSALLHVRASVSGIVNDVYAPTYQMHRYHCTMCWQMCWQMCCDKEACVLLQVR